MGLSPFSRANCSREISGVRKVGERMADERELRRRGRDRKALRRER